MSKLISKVAKTVHSISNKKEIEESNLNRENQLLIQMERKLATYQVALITIHDVLKG